MCQDCNEFFGKEIFKNDEDVENEDGLARAELEQLLALLGVVRPKEPTVEESLNHMALMLGAIVWQLGKEFTVLRSSVEEFAGSTLVVDGNETASGDFKFELVTEVKQ